MIGRPPGGGGAVGINKDIDMRKSITSEQPKSLGMLRN